MANFPPPETADPVPDPPVSGLAAGLSAHSDNRPFTAAATHRGCTGWSPRVFLLFIGERRRRRGLPHSGSLEPVVVALLETKYQIPPRSVIPTDMGGDLTLDIGAMAAAAAAAVDAAGSIALSFEDRDRRSQCSAARPSHRAHRPVPATARRVRRRIRMAGAAVAFLLLPGGL